MENLLLQLEYKAADYCWLSEGSTGICPTDYDTEK